MGLAEIRADVSLARDQILSATSLEDLKTQLVDNVLPLLEGLTDTTRDELARRDEVLQSVADDIDEIMDQSGDVLQPETAGRILAVFEAGKILAAELEALVKKADDLTKKRVVPLIKAFRQAVLVETEHLTQITIPDEEEIEEEVAPAPAKKKTAPGPENEDEDDDSDDDDDGDEYEDDVAAEER